MVIEHIPDEENPLVELIAHGDIEGVRQLIGQGVDVNQFSEDSSPPIHWAVFYDQPETMKMLLEAGSDINAPCVAYGLRALNWAVRRNISPETLQLVLEAGANPNYASQYGDSPLLDALKTDNLEHAKILTSHGARSDFLPSVIRSDSKTAFQRAVLLGRAEFVELFARACSEDFDQTAPSGETLFELAKNRPNMELLLQSLRTQLEVERGLEPEAGTEVQSKRALRSASLTL